MKKWSYKKNKKHSIVILIVSVVFLFLVLFFTSHDNRKLTFPEKLLKNTGLFISDILSKPFTFLQEALGIGDVMDSKKMEENIASRYQEEIDQLHQELKELKDLMEIKTLSHYSSISATVSYRDLDFWFDTILLDKGSKAGITNNMAVVTPSGLIGKVIKTTSSYSTVKLLTSDDTDNKVSVQIQVDGKSVYGILKSYDKRENLYTVEGITDQVEMKKGMRVSTTGLGTIFPSGILVGTVFQVERDNFDLAYVVKVKPSVDFQSFHYVKVLKREVS